MENIAANEDAEINSLNPETGNQSDTQALGSQDSGQIENGSETLVTEDELIYEKDEKTPKIVSPYDRPGKWYVVHTQSGYENKVQGNLAQRIQSMNKEDSIHEVVIPLSLIHI